MRRRSGGSTRSSVRSSPRRTGTAALPLILAVTLIAACGGDDAESNAASRTAVASGPAIHTEGNVLVENAQRFVVKGAAAYLLPFYTRSDGSADNGIGPTAQRNFEERATIFARMAELGINTLRVPVALATYEDDVYDLGGKVAYLDRLEAVVTDANAAGLLVIVGWWDSLGSRGDWPEEATSVHGMMRDVYGRLQGNDQVVYEPWNEPNGVTWDEWTDTTNATVELFRSDLGYRGLLIVDTIDFSWNFSDDRADELLDLDAELLGGAPNIAFANHRYANLNTCFCGDELESWDNVVGQHVDEYPIVGTEYGFWNDLGDPVPLWNRQLVAHLIDMVDEGFNGYVGFVWDWSDPNTLTTGDLVTLNEHGTIAAQFWSTEFPV